jgi:hypothetical protein
MPRSMPDPPSKPYGLYPASAAAAAAAACSSNSLRNRDVSTSVWVRKHSELLLFYQLPCWHRLYGVAHAGLILHACLMWRV